MTVTTTDAKTTTTAKPPFLARLTGPSSKRRWGCPAGSWKWPGTSSLATPAKHGLRTCWASHTDGLERSQVNALEYLAQ